MAHEASAEAARMRFAAATEAHLRGALTDEVRIEAVEAGAWQAEAEGLWQRANARAPAVEYARLTSDDERAGFADLEAVMGAPLEHRLLLKAGDEVVGTYWGQQQASGRYYMVNSAVAPAWQRRGLYRALLRRVVAAATESGFREIYSRHRADNNAVLIPKLQAGFVIAAFEVTPRHGLLVHLRLYPGEGPRKAFEYRIDGAHADELRARGVLR